MSIALDTWREYIAYHPYHFWQFADENLLRVNSKCNDVVYEQAYLSADSVGRDDIRRSIREACNDLFKWLGYRVGGEFVTRNNLQYYPEAETMWYGYIFKPVNVGEGFIRALGVQNFTPLDNVAVVYSDQDGDGINETFTVTILNITNSLDEIDIYFVDTDVRANSTIPERIIEPVKKSIDNTTVTITGSSWILGRPVIYGSFDNSTFSPDTSNGNIFAQTVDVIRTFVFETGRGVDNAPVVLHYEICDEDVDVGAFVNNVGCFCQDTLFGENFTITEVNGCRVLNIPACGQLRDKRRGEIGVPGWIPPERVTIRFFAGATIEETNSTIAYSSNWEQIVTALSTARVARRICACDVANRRVYEWQTDRAQTGEGLDNFSISDTDLDNGFGTKAGEIYAWKHVRRLSKLRTFAR